MAFLLETQFCYRRIVQIGNLHMKQEVNATSGTFDFKHKGRYTCPSSTDFDDISSLNACMQLCQGISDCSHFMWLPADVQSLPSYSASSKCKLNINAAECSNPAPGFYNMWHRVTDYSNDVFGLLETINVVVRHSETSVDFFIDGIKVQREHMLVPSYILRSQNLVGKSNTNIFETFEGFIDDFYLWGRVLSDVEITSTVLNKKCKSGMGTSLLLSSRATYFLDTQPQYFSGTPQEFYLSNIASRSIASQSDGMSSEAASLMGSTECTKHRGR